VNEEMRELTKRVSGLEVAVGKLQLAISGMYQGIAVAREAPVECSMCGDDMTDMVTCPFEDCPCGIPTEITDE